MNKKGQVETLAPVVITLIIAATVLVLGIVMFQELRDTETISQNFQTTVTNETGVNTSGSSGYTVTRASTEPCFNGFTMIAANNGTTSINEITSGNWSSTSAGILTNASDDFTETLWNITYSYSSGGEVCDSTNETLLGIANFSDFWEIIVIAIIVTVVIGLILAGFGRRMR